MSGTRFGRMFIISVIVGCYALSVRAEKAVDFTREIQPILADNCYACHGPDAAKRKADMRLDLLDPKEGPFAPREGYSIIVPGKLDDSVLIMRITSDDPDVKMPPTASHRKITAQQIELIKKWVEQGAKWGKHWSLEAPKKAELPAVKDAAWCRTPVDRFILARLEKEGLTPSAEAPRETLIRRVTLDLTGLPPTPQEVEAFVKDPSSDAYEKVVDRLLASRRYGERMAWDWLDVARYADTNGYQNDPTRTMWPWRDWVIKALNENIPYDQFATWQLAGDLLPNATEEQKIASGFNRNHPYNGEGGRIAEETRVENVMDRVDTTATTFLGLTIGCAKCHDHKFDPITQKDYYSLFAYFNQCSEIGDLKYVNEGNVAPVVRYSTAEQKAKWAELKKASAQAAQKLAEARPRLEQAEQQWTESARFEKGWIIATPSSAISKGGATLQVLPDRSILASGLNPETDAHEVVLKTDLTRVTAIELEALPWPTLPQGGPGRSLDSANFVMNEVDATVGGKKVKFAAAEATYSQEAWDVNGAVDGDPKTGWAIWKAPDVQNISAIFYLAEPVTIESGQEIHLTFHYQNNYKQHTMGRFRLALSDGSALTPTVASVLAKEDGDRSEDEQRELWSFYQKHVSTEYRQLTDAAAAAKKAADEYPNNFTNVMVMDDATPRETHVLVKGAYDKPTDKVEPAVPGVLPALSRGEKNNRLALAKWLFDPANPLTARVTVNRYWQQFFGIGIVKTVDDFGVQGERPVHPELLDWLAVQFRESGWNVKAMHRLLVTSSVYRQSSKVTPELHEQDPENRLLARGPRFRLPSVVIRDEALAAAGLLVEKEGGPAVKPYQPPGIWEEATFGKIKYEQDHGEALYRRSIYTFWRRIVGPTELFDTASRTACVVKPLRTNTPLHALTTWNDTTFVEAARGVASRVLAAEASPEKRIAIAYRLVLGRNPKAQEQSVLTAGLNRLMKTYASDPATAKKLLAVGESKRDEKLDPCEHAAYTALCLEILNLDETMTKE